MSAQLSCIAEKLPDEELKVSRAHTVGASQRAAVEEASAETVDNMFELNVNGTLRLTRAILPRLLEQAGKGDPAKFVVIGSLAAEVCLPFTP